MNKKIEENDKGKILAKIGIECTKKEEDLVLAMCANTFPYLEVMENLTNYLEGKEEVQEFTIEAMKPHKAAIEDWINTRLRDEDYK